MSVEGSMSTSEIVKSAAGFAITCGFAAFLGYGFVGAILEGVDEAEAVGRAAHDRNPITVERTIDADGAVIETASFVVVRRGGR